MFRTPQGRPSLGPHLGLHRAVRSCRRLCGCGALRLCHQSVRACVRPMNLSHWVLCQELMKCLGSRSDLPPPQPDPLHLCLMPRPRPLLSPPPLLPSAALPYLPTCLPPTRPPAPVPRPLSPPHPSSDPHLARPCSLHRPPVQAPSTPFHSFVRPPPSPPPPPRAHPSPQLRACLSWTMERVIMCARSPWTV